MMAISISISPCTLYNLERQTVGKTQLHNNSLFVAENGLLKIDKIALHVLVAFQRCLPRNVLSLLAVQRYRLLSSPTTNDHHTASYRYSKRRQKSLVVCSQILSAAERRNSCRWPNGHVRNEIKALCGVQSATFLGGSSEQS